MYFLIDILCGKCRRVDVLVHDLRTGNSGTCEFYVKTFYHYDASRAALRKAMRRFPHCAVHVTKVYGD